jgi:ketosteroid isomerase-like protein
VDVVLLSSLEEKGNADTVQKHEAGSESPQVLNTKEWTESGHQHLICPVCKKDHLGGKSCIRCGAELVSPILPQKEEKTRQPRPVEPKKLGPKTPSLPESKEVLFQDEALDQQTPKRTVEDQIKIGRFARKVKKDYPRVFLNWTGIAVICIAVGYFAWSAYSHIVAKKPDVSPPSVSQETASSSVAVSRVIASPGSPLTEAEEVEQIGKLLDDIRKANLEKNIDLFLSCYAKDFKDREGKKRATLQSWANFNFLDLTYFLEPPSLSGNGAGARVEWLARFTTKNGGQPHESKTVLNVIFKKEDGAWKIGEIKSSL